MRTRIAAMGCGLALVLAGCSGKPAAEDTTGADAPAGDVAADRGGDPVDDEAPPGNPQAPETTPSGLQAKDGSPIALVPFDPDSVPLSAVALGDLPFVSLPAGYGPVNRPHQRAYARFPFRLGDGLHWVEGASWNSLIGIDRDQGRDKQFSPLELRRNLETVLAQAGAQKVFEGPLNRDLYYGPQLEGEIGGGFIDGVNLDAQTPTTVHVIRQADRNVWVQLSTNAYSAALVVVDERPFTATAHWQEAFPHLSRPAGYDWGNQPKSRDFDMYPFWTGSAFEEVEGPTYVASISAEPPAQSQHEVRRNLEAMMAEVGGTKVFEGRIPKEASERITFEQKSPYSDGTGFSWHDYDSLVYRVDLPDGRQVWVHARLESQSAGWVVAERKGFAQTSALLPAAALKQQLDADGRVAIEVNFAVDKAEILPDSQPQLDQVLALLQQDPALSLAVEGHTDNTGAADHNRTLSQARAASVVAALTGKGIDGARLSASGFGADRPVADNATDAGRAKNRRVELVKRH